MTLVIAKPTPNSPLAPPLTVTMHRKRHCLAYPTTTMIGVTMIDKIPLQLKNIMLESNYMGIAVTYESITCGQIAQAVNTDKHCKVSHWFKIFKFSIWPDFKWNLCYAIITSSEICFTHFPQRIRILVWEIIQNYFQPWPGQKKMEFIRVRIWLWIVWWKWHC